MTNKELYTLLGKSGKTALKCITDDGVVATDLTAAQVKLVHTALKKQDDVSQTDATPCVDAPRADVVSTYEESPND